MPIYEFACDKCGFVTNLLCRVGTTGDELECARCRSTGLRRLLSRFASPGSGGGSDCGSCAATSCGSCPSKG